MPPRRLKENDWSNAWNYGNGSRNELRRLVNTALYSALVRWETLANSQPSARAVEEATKKIISKFTWEDQDKKKQAGEVDRGQKNKKKEARDELQKAGQGTAWVR